MAGTPALPQENIEPLPNVNTINVEEIRAEAGRQKVLQNRVATYTRDTVERRVSQYFEDIPILIQIARCESGFRQYDKYGEVLRGLVNSSDVGVFQINKYYHSDRAESLGLDLNTIEGNMAYARDLYNREGTQPWSASKKCWSGYREIAQK